MDTQARERIIESALALFAERGNEAVSIRDIATAADVSPALIPHHFGSKAGLVEAVDARVIGIFDHLAGALQEPASLAATMADQFPTDAPLLGYLRRSLLDGSDTGRRVFRQWFEMTVELMKDLEQQGIVRRSTDPQTRAALLMANDLSLILLSEHIGDALESDPLSPDGLARWSHEAMDIYTHGIFTTDPETAPDSKESS
ncbi:TetR/AcrR family transcriptional regulator [Demequina flava]|uniref:TetR/AcrR family transcriptional regulator n=1 Tax=Demequina flava TaxID=1095025 RepID=UPI00078198CA|nr:TetR family transcriptional regulator [Demequina flava]